jgi:hypothetical protein
MRGPVAIRGPVAMRGPFVMRGPVASLYVSVCNVAQKRRTCFPRARQLGTFSLTLVPAG